MYSIKSTARALDVLVMEQFDTPMVWLSSLWSKVNIFGWRLRRNFLLCNLNLTLRGIHAPSLSCSLCMEDCESTEHVILGYSFIVKLRNLVASWWGIKLLFLWDMTNLYSQDTLNLVPKNYISQLLGGDIDDHSLGYLACKERADHGRYILELTGNLL